MRFFRHGDTLAIVLPEKLKKSSEVKDGEEYEFFEAERGTFILISRRNLEEQARKSVYAELLRGKGGETKEKNEADAEPEKAIFSIGFAVIEREEDAKRVSQLLEKEIKAKNVLGVRGFDKKFYIVSSEFYRQNALKLLRAMGSREMPLKDISISSRIEERACLALLQVMKEQGEIIEKRKGIYKAIK